ncbi:MAG TPA: hypothetical protein VH877_28535 [Polyangia bacterium]|jgi:hypothetical protein|nr:hypothetical protein [Polyangia bacterium]
MKTLRAGLVGLIALLGLGTLGGCYGDYYYGQPGYYSGYYYARPGYYGPARGYYAARPHYYGPYRGYSYSRGGPGYQPYRVAPPPPARYYGGWRGPGHFGYGHRGHWR